MSTHEEPRRIDPDTAERLISGGPDARRTGHQRLAGLLAVASAPGRPDELAGHAAALNSFRAASRDLVSRPRRWHMVRASIAKLLTVKVIAVCGAATVGLGGIAVAATTGNLPGPPNIADSAARGPTDRPTESPSGRPQHTLPPAAWQRLCRDYLGRDHEHRRQALGDQAFHELVDHVGGRDRDKADSFCDKVLRGGPTNTPSVPPSESGRFPTSRPTGATNGGPNGGNIGGPSGGPTGGTSGGPNDFPNARPTSGSGQPSPNH